MNQSLDAFLQTDLGRSAQPAEVRLLERLRLVDDVLPDEALYTVMLLVLQHRLTAAQADEALEHNRRLLESARAKAGGAA
jgi:hypothetical protein